MKRRMAVFIAVCMATMNTSTLMANNYADTANHWASSSISKWSDYNIVDGYSDGSFKPNKAITRGEMAVILNRIMKYQSTSNDEIFDDLGDGFYKEAILKLHNAGVIQGNNGKARPNDCITREEAIVMIGRVFQFAEQGSEGINFTDANQISSWAKGMVNVFSKLGYISGRGNNEFAPKANMTRAELVTLLDHITGTVYNAAGVYSQDVTGSVIINSPDVVLENMTITGDLIIAPGVAEGEVKLNNVTVKGDVYVRGGGENSVILNNFFVDGNVVVNKVGGTVRVVATGKTVIHTTFLASGALMVERELTGGGFESVIISEEVIAGSKIVLKGDFKSVTNKAVDINIEAEGSIEKLVVEKKATATGACKVANIEVAQGADSMLFGKNVIGGTSTTDSSKGSSGGSGGGGSSSSGGSNGGGTTTSGGIVVNPSDPTSPENPTKPEENPTNPEENPTNPEENPTNPEEKPTEPDDSEDEFDADFVDAYFVNGYPKGEKVNGKVQVQIQLKEEALPARVYMIVNTYNSHITPNVEAVIHGHTGNEENLVQVPEYPLVDISDTDVHTISCNTFIDLSNDYHIYFVIEDKDGNVSEKPTRISINEATIKELDEVSPYMKAAYIDSNNTNVYLYYDELLDESSIPETDCFEVKSEVVSEAVTPSSIKITSISERDNMYKSKVMLEFDTPIEGEYISISYNGSDKNPLQDRATTPNQAEKFSNEDVIKVDYSISDMYVSEDCQYYYFKMNPCYDSFRNSHFLEGDAIKLIYKGSPIKVDSSRSSYSMGHGVDVYFTIAAEDAAKIDDKNSLELQAKLPEDTVGYTGEPLPDTIYAESGFISVPVPQVENVTYMDDKLVITYNTEVNEPAVGCTFKLKVNGKVYTLRGNPDRSNNTSIIFDTSNIPTVISSTDEVSVIYTPSVDEEENVVNGAGQPCAAFEQEVVFE